MASSIHPRLHRKIQTLNTELARYTLDGGGEIWVHKEAIIGHGSNGSLVLDSNGNRDSLTFLSMRAMVREVTDNTFAITTRNAEWYLGGVKFHDGVKLYYNSPAGWGILSWSERACEMERAWYEKTKRLAAAMRSYLLTYPLENSDVIILPYLSPHAIRNVVSRDSYTHTELSMIARRAIQGKNIVLDAPTPDKIVTEIEKYVNLRLGLFEKGGY